MRSAQLPRRLHLSVVLDDGDYLASSQRGDVENHQPQRAAADHRYCVASMGTRVFKPVDSAGQRFCKRRVLQGNVIGNTQGVFCHDARRDANELGVGAVIEKQVVAKILLTAPAKITFTAGCRIQRHDAIAGSELSDSFSSLNYGSGKLVSKEGGRHDHARMISAAKHLEVRTARQRRTHLHDQFSRSSLWHWNALDANVVASVEDCGLHGGAAVMDCALYRCPAVMDYALYRCPAMMDCVFNRGAAMFDHSFDRGTAVLDRGFNRRAAALDCGFYRAWHQAPPTLPPPGTGSIIIFIESALGCDAISIAATACSSGKRWEIN